MRFVLRVYLGYERGCVKGVQEGRALLVGDEDLESADDLCQRDRTVILPVLDGFHVVDHDHEVFVFALVVDFGVVTVSASHFDGIEDWLRLVWVVCCPGFLEMCVSMWSRVVDGF